MAKELRAMRHPINSQQQQLDETAGEDPTFEDSPSYQILRPRHDPIDSVLMTLSDFKTKYSVGNGYPEGTAQKNWDNAPERSPPLLESKYRLGHGLNLDMDKELKRREPEYYLRANSTAGKNAATCCFAYTAGLVCCMPCWLQTFAVPVGTVRRLEDGQGGYMLAGEGMHMHYSPFMSKGKVHHYNKGVLTHGDWCLVVVDQGYIGLAFDKGQPVLLPPGFHQWKSTTLVFERVIDLNEPVIYLGPYTLLTVDEGYAAVTQDNGMQEVKPGGAVHLLSHRNHKFEKFLSTKIQTDKLARIEVITGDNVLMICDATVNWKISDVQLAARNAAETMVKRGGNAPHPQGMGSERTDNDNITKLRNDVLQQASASLSSFIGTVNYSDTFAPSAAVQQASNKPTVGVPVASSSSADPGIAAGGVLFDYDRMQNAVQHSNAVTSQYGVEIISINIISAKPADAKLMTSLARGAVAAAEAQQLETTARGASTATMIDARARADAQLVQTKAEALCMEIEAKSKADADETRARGAKNAADMLAASELACELSKIEKTGAAIGSSSSLFFGCDASKLGSLLANPSVVSK